MGNAFVCAWGCVCVCMCSRVRNLTLVTDQEVVSQLDIPVECTVVGSLVRYTIVQVGRQYVQMRWRCTASHFPRRELKWGLVCRLVQCRSVLYCILYCTVTTTFPVFVVCQSVNCGLLQVQGCIYVVCLLCGGSIKAVLCNLYNDVTLRLGLEFLNV